MSWFEVTATVKVDATDERDAINQVAHSVTVTNIPTVYPVGAFRAKPCENPLTVKHVHLPR